MKQSGFSIIGNGKAKKRTEQAASGIFFLCGMFAILAVVVITAYMILKGTPALGKVGILEVLFGTVWKPEAADPSFGILYVILTSIIGTTLAVILGVPIGLLQPYFWRKQRPKGWRRL